jgi:hypothetical protein
MGRVRRKLSLEHTDNIQENKMERTLSADINRRIMTLAIDIIKNRHHRGTTRSLVHTQPGNEESKEVSKTKITTNRQKKKTYTSTWTGFLLTVIVAKVTGAGAARSLSTGFLTGLGTMTRSFSKA